MSMICSRNTQQWKQKTIEAGIHCKSDAWKKTFITEDTQVIITATLAVISWANTQTHGEYHTIEMFSDTLVFAI